ncbi:hypothetical protein GARC_2377 [Paraglaciecola arctica BSs20135]|uniref:Uncharacterized protein n=1 Tax=Paraglaciecola arctica BSs20135 TaxID=493475 RepID=K6YRQ1_9ALTE|nr:hypothetical protein GARC_2377 [Paraglaciecola arctica BSs20135]
MNRKQLDIIPIKTLILINLHLLKNNLKSTIDLPLFSP